MRDSTRENSRSGSTSSAASDTGDSSSGTGITGSLNNGVFGSGRSKNRRGFLKLTATGLGTALAGCGGDGGDTPTDGGGGDGGDGGDGDGGVTDGDQTPSLSGTEIDYWNIENVQSQAARDTYVALIEQFEQDTGVRISLNLSGYQQLSGQQWISAWRNQDYPVVYDTEDFYMGRMFATGYCKPASEYQEQLPDEYWDAIQWTREIRDHGYRFWDAPDPGWINIPVACGPRNGMTLRTDLMGEAGYSADDIPRTGDAVENYTQLMEMAVDIQENSSAQYGFQTFGVSFDVNDILNQWISSQNADAATYLTQDATQGNWDASNDIWTEWFQRYNDVQYEYGVTAENSASISDEQATQLQVGGDVAMSMVEWLNYPTFRDRAPDAMENGDMQFVNMWDGNSGFPGQLGYHDYGINDKPPNIDQQRWDRKVRAGTEMIKRFLGEDFQTAYPTFVGFFPIRDDMWDATRENAESLALAEQIDAMKNILYAEPSNYLNAGFSMMEKCKYGWPLGHLHGSAILFTDAGPTIQNMMRQQTDIEEGVNQLGQMATNHAQDAIDQLGEVGTWEV